MNRVWLLLVLALPCYSQMTQAPTLPATNTSIVPFHVQIPQAQIDDLRRRLAATRWPDKETVADASQGAQLAKMQELVRYWGTGYDWRKAEAKLNALPQFTTNIDGVDIHFIHVKSKEKNALPLIITHGWPGSVIEQLKIIDPLTNPTAHGGSAADAFDVVIPSLPGYGFSGHPSGPGGQPPGAAHGTDLDAEGNGTLTEQRTYQCIRQSGPIIDRTCTIEFLDRGVEVYCFTFG